MANKAQVKSEIAKPLQGKTIRFKWEEGPTRGSTHEHVFHEDSISWKAVDTDEKCKESTEKTCGAVKIGEDLFLVSYLGSSGFTLSVALDLKKKKLNGFASGAKDWFPVSGTLEVM